MPIDWTGHGEFGGEVHLRPWLCQPCIIWNRGERLANPVAYQPNSAAGECYQMLACRWPLGIFVMSCFLIHGQCVEAQVVEATQPPATSVGMSLQTLEQMALQTNPSLQRALHLIGATQGTALQVGLPPNPSFGYQGQQIGSRGRAEQHGITFSQEIVAKDKLSLNRSVACQDIVLAQQQLVAQRLRVLTDVRMAFYRALRAQRQIDVTTELEKISQQALKSAEALFKAQEVGKTDVLQAQMEVESAAIQLQNARNRHRAAWSELTAVIGQGALEPQPLDGDLYAAARNFDYQDLSGWLRSQSPEVSSAAASIDRARLNLQRQLVETRPNLSLQGLVNWRDNGINGDADGGVAVAVPVPIWNRNQGAIHQARQQLAAAEKSLEQLGLDLQHRLAPIFERYANARYQVERLREHVLPLASQALELTSQTYQAGEVGFVSLLTAQRTYNERQLGLLEALEALRVAEAEIDGMLLSSSLQGRQ